MSGLKPTLYVTVLSQHRDLTADFIGSRPATQEVVERGAFATLTPLLSRERRPLCLQHSPRTPDRTQPPNQNKLSQPDTYTQGLSLFFRVSVSSTIRQIQRLLFSEALWSADGQHAPGRAFPPSPPPTHQHLDNRPAGAIVLHVVYRRDNAEAAGHRVTHPAVKRRGQSSTPHRTEHSDDGKSKRK